MWKLIFYDKALLVAFPTKVFPSKSCIYALDGAVLSGFGAVLPQPQRALYLP